MRKILMLSVALILTWNLALGQSRRDRKRLDLFETLQGEYLGKLSANRYDSESTSNRFGIYGSPYSARSIKNPYNSLGTGEFSSGSQSPAIVGADGTYLGRLNRNRFDPESVANPYGTYGSKYSPTSINNPYSIYGSPYSSYSATSPYTYQAPKLFATPTSPSCKFCLDKRE